MPDQRRVLALLVVLLAMAAAHTLPAAAQLDCQSLCCQTTCGLGDKILCSACIAHCEAKHNRCPMGDCLETCCKVPCAFHPLNSTFCTTCYSECLQNEGCFDVDHSKGRIAIISALALLSSAATLAHAASPARGLGEPPCYGDLGTSRRGVDVGYGAGQPFSSTHVSHWNFTEPWLRMRYDVFQYSLVDNSYTESHHLFLYDQKTRYTWFNKSDACTMAPQPTVVYECIPSTFVPVSYHTVVGVNTTQWQDDRFKPTAAQVSTNALAEPILSSIIAFDDNQNIKEFVQIQDYVDHFDPATKALELPDFCTGSDVQKTTAEELNEFLPTAVRRIHLLNEADSIASQQAQ